MDESALLFEVDEAGESDAKISEIFKAPRVVTLERFSRLVAGVHAASIRPSDWPVALDDLGRALGGSGCGLITGTGPKRSVMAATVPPEARDVYIEHYHAIDYVLDAVENGPTGLILGGNELVARRPGSEFATDFLYPFEMDDGLFVRLFEDGLACSLLVAAPARSEPFATTDRVRVLRALVPHLQQALHVQDKLTALTDTALEAAGALDHVRYGVTVIAGDHSIINLNSAAERILRAQDGIGVRSGRISVTSARAQRDLQTALTCALSGGPSEVRSGGSFSCARPSGKRSFVVHVLPLDDRATPERSTRPSAVLLIIDPETRAEPNVLLLQRLYGLTDAEAEIAVRIVHGADLTQISEALSVSYTTVRTHLQHVFDKTHTHRQAELVSLLLVLCP